MTKIYKYQIPPNAWLEAAIVRIPRGANILCVQAQHDIPTIWAEVDPDEPSRDHKIIVAATGDEPPQNRAYLGTVQLQGGSLVFHVYELLDPL